MRKIILFLFVLFILFVSNVFSDEEYDNYAGLSKAETIKKINHTLYNRWENYRRILSQHRIADLCGFLDKERVFELQGTVSRLDEKIEELKYHYKKITGNDFPEIKRNDEYYMIYAAKIDNCGFDLEALSVFEEEKAKKKIKKHENYKNYYEKLLNKLLEESKIGGVINKVKAYNLGLSIIQEENAKNEFIFYYEYVKKIKKKED